MVASMHAHLYTISTDGVSPPPPPSPSHMATLTMAPPPQYGVLYILCLMGAGDALHPTLDARILYQIPSRMEICKQM